MYQQTKKQNGFVVILLLLIISLGVTSYLLKELDFSQVEEQRQEKTQRALAETKDEIIARMLTNANGAAPTMVGQMLCPDLDDSGITGPGCGNYEGRLPYKTLNMEDKRDDSTEKLWYVTSRLMNTDRINSTTLSIGAGPGFDLLTVDGQTNVLAILASPGQPINAAQRIARPSNNIQDYLEGLNADNDTSFTKGFGLNNFNDKIITITTNDVIDVVHERVFAAAREYLEDFFNKEGFYPYPEDNDFSCNSVVPVNLGLNQAGVNIVLGRIPISFVVDVPGPQLCSYGATTVDISLNSTFNGPNDFRDEIWYAVSDKCARDGLAPRCAAGGAANEYVYLDGVPMKYIIFIAGQLPAPDIGLPNYCDGIPNPGHIDIGSNVFCSELEDYDLLNQNTDGNNEFFSNNFNNTNRNDRIYGEPL